MLQSGDILHIYVTFIRPPHYKFVVCVCPKHPLFFFINTGPGSFTPDADVFVEKAELRFLDHDSYIDTSLVVTFPQVELDQAEKKGVLTDSIKARISDTLTQHKYLAPVHAKKIMKNLTPSQSTQLSNKISILEQELLFLDDGPWVSPCSESIENMAEKTKFPS